jgi:hypothetical protein
VFATIVDTSALLKTVAAAAIAGIGIAFIFSFAILGAARFVEYGRDGRPAAAGLFGILAIIALLASAAAVTVGIIVMTQK